MYNNEDYEVYSKVEKLEDLNIEEEYKIELEWWIEFSDELTHRMRIPEGKIYITHAIGTVKWNPSLGQWQLIDITMIDCHAASILVVYGYGEVIDLEEQNICVTKSSLRIVERLGRDIQKHLDEYIGKPKVKDLSILRCEGISDDFNKEPIMYF